MKVELKNVAEIAFFRMQGFEIVALRVSNETARKTVYFELEGGIDEEAFKQTRALFLNRRASVEPRAFAECIKNTTDLLFEELRKSKGG